MAQNVRQSLNKIFVFGSLKCLSFFVCVLKLGMPFPFPMAFSNKMLVLYCVLNFVGSQYNQS